MQLVFVALSLLGAALPGCDFGNVPVDWNGPDTGLPPPADAGLDAEDAEPDAAVPTHADVVLLNLSIQPPEVTIAAGGDVTWTNQDPSPHDIRSGAPGAPTGEITSALLNRGQGYTHVFTTPGTIHYYCSTHSSVMQNGIVEVVPP